jgi:hypothetical protein
MPRPCRGRLRGRTLPARSIRDKAAVVSNDVSSDETLSSNKIYAEVGVRSIAGQRVAALLIDLERFKKFNDKVGRPAGDALLKQVAQWLEQHAGSIHVLAPVFFRGAETAPERARKASAQGRLADLVPISEEHIPCGLTGTSRRCIP